MVKDQCSGHIERSQFFVVHTQRCLVTRRLQMFSRRFHRREEIVDVGVKETLPFLWRVASQVGALKPSFCDGVQGCWR